MTEGEWPLSPKGEVGVLGKPREASGRGALHGGGFVYTGTAFHLGSQLINAAVEAA